MFCPPGPKPVVLTDTHRLGTAPKRWYFPLEVLKRDFSSNDFETLLLLCPASGTQRPARTELPLSSRSPGLGFLVTLRTFCLDLDAEDALHEGSVQGHTAEAGLWALGFLERLEK